MREPLRQAADESYGTLPSASPSTGAVLPFVAPSPPPPPAPSPSAWSATQPIDPEMLPSSLMREMVIAPRSPADLHAVSASAQRRRMAKAMVLGALIAVALLTALAMWLTAS